MTKPSLSTEWQNSLYPPNEKIPSIHRMTKPFLSTEWQNRLYPPNEKIPSIHWRTKPSLSSKWQHEIKCEKTSGSVGNKPDWITIRLIGCLLSRRAFRAVTSKKSRQGTWILKRSTNVPDCALFAGLWLVHPASWRDLCPLCPSVLSPPFSATAPLKTTALNIERCSLYWPVVAVDCVKKPIPFYYFFIIWLIAFIQADWHIETDLQKLPFTVTYETDAYSLTPLEDALLQTYRWDATVLWQLLKMHWQWPAAEAAQRTA